MMSFTLNVGDINLVHLIKMSASSKADAFPFVIDKPFVERVFETMKISYFPSNSHEGAVMEDFSKMHFTKDMY